MLTNFPFPDSFSNLAIDSQQALNITSDHYVITFSVSSTSNFLKQKQSPPQFIFDYSRADWEGLLSHLFNFNFADFYTFNALYEDNLVKNFAFKKDYSISSHNQIPTTIHLDNTFATSQSIPP